MEILFLWVGLLFACIGALILRFSETEFSGAHVDGEVIGYIPHTDSEGSRSYSPVVAFVHPFAGRRILHSAFGSASFLYPVGARVTVLADRQDPHLARLDTNAFRYFGLVFIATGLGLCVLFFSIFDWSGFSVAIAALVSAAMFWKARAQRHVFGKAVGIGAVMRRTLGGSAVEAARFDRSQLLSSVELTSTHRRTARQSAIGGVILVLLGAGGMFGSWLGRVVDLAVSDTSDSTTYAPVVEFTPQYASSAIRFRHSVASSHPSWRVGQEVGVLSDPRDPSNAIIDQGWWTTAFLMIPGAIGVLVVILGLSSLYTARRRARTDGPN